LISSLVVVVVVVVVVQLSIIFGVINPEFETHNRDFFETAIFLITFVLLGRYLENKAKGKTSEAITKLLALRSKVAILLHYDDSNHQIVNEEEIDIDLVEKGDILKIVPGSSIPTDGISFIHTFSLSF
jgi:Cu+-exporting ATPase